MPRRLTVDEVAAQAVNTAFRLEEFFPEFSGELCMKVFPRSGVEEYALDERLVQQGDAGRDLFLILSGRVSVVQEMGSMAAELATLEAGVVVGEVALLRDGVRTASIVAMAPTLVFRLAFEDVGYVLQNNPPLHAHLEDLAKRRTA
jgi:CRP/FNR family cyclic AMP-dependent transcriptional regulator